MSVKLSLQERSQSTSPASALDLRDVDVTFGSTTGLRGINMSVAPSERVALLGPSGSGKTTLLRAIAGLDAFSAGSLTVNGVDMTNARPEQRGVVYLHQTPALFPHLSVRDNVAFPMRLRGESRHMARAKANDILESVQLHQLADRLPDRLSGGEKHRTALARALAASPRVLLLDEPFAALDPGLRNEIREQVLAVLAPPGSPAAIVVTHDVDEATMFGNRIAVLLNGRIAQCDSATTVVREPSTLAVAQFLGVPNQITGTCNPSTNISGVWESPVGTSSTRETFGRFAAVGWADMLVVQSPRETDAASNDIAGAAGIVVAVEHRGMGHVVRVQLEDTVVVGLAEPDASWHAGDRVTVALRTRSPHLLPLADDAPVSATRASLEFVNPAPHHV